MTLAVSELNSLPAEAAADRFRSCCGSTRWVESMVARRPFGSLDELLLAADQEWAATNASDWHEAFSHHPRIGERQSVATQSAEASRWSAGEQTGMNSASVNIRSELAEINREYESRFGHVYIVCATSRTGEELVAMAKQRMHNDPASELTIAAEEQRQITRLRLRKLLGASA